MKGAVVFLVVLAIVLLVSLGYPDIPPGQLIYDAVGGVDVDYSLLGIPLATLIPAVFNGVIYGFIVWLLFSIGSAATRREAKEQVIRPTVSVQVLEPPKEVVEEPMSVSITSLEGVGTINAEKLAVVGITTSIDLLEAGRTRRGRADLAQKAGISPKLILEWVNLADLIRIKGVSEQYSDLLEEAGVDTVAELARRNPDNLHAKLQEVNEDKELVRRLPSASTVADWVEQAKKLPRIVEH